MSEKRIEAKILPDAEYIILNLHCVCGYEYRKQSENRLLVSGAAPSGPRINSYFRETQKLMKFQKNCLVSGFLFLEYNPLDNMLCYTNCV